MTTLALPKYHRQKFVLALLQLSGGELSPMDFQKLLFLASQEPEFAGHYDFIPYYYGCYSFQAQSDVELMAKRDWLQVGEKKITMITPYCQHIPPSERAKINRFLRKFEKLRGNKLIHYVYSHFPYYAINSKIAHKVLNEKQNKKVQQIKFDAPDKPQLMTIGYEGISFENYINKLIKNNVKALVDVRKNPLSRKFGFSKSTLKTTLPKLGIEYSHKPELGVASENRKNLNSTQQYSDLFTTYKEQLLNKKLDIESILSHLLEYKRVALTCFEHEHTECHRHCISDYLEHNHNQTAKHL